jgi:hypothetical protein
VVKESVVLNESHRVLGVVLYLLSESKVKLSVGNDAVVLFIYSFVFQGGTNGDEGIAWLLKK